MSAGRSRFLLVASLWTLGAGRSAAADHPADQQALVQRLEESAVRLRALEQTVRLQAEQLAEERRRLDTLLAQLCPAASAAVGAPLGRPKTQGRTFQRVEAPPERPVTHRAVSFGLGGLVQGWYVAGDHGQRDTFRVRRTELYFSGQITEKGRWLIMVDPAKALSLEQSFTSLGEAPAAAGVTVNQASRILQNAQVTFDYIPRMQVTIGQFKVPLSREGLESSGRLDTIERALFASDRARGGAYGDVRDIGLMVNGLLGPRVDYHLGVFNGVVESQNDVDRDEFRRLGNGRGERPRRDRIGGEVQLVKGPFTVRSELMAGWDGAVSRRGYYALLGYRAHPRVEGILRLDVWDPDTDSEATPASATERDYQAGVNVLLSHHNLKLQANYVRKTFRRQLGPDRNVILVNAQTFW